MYIFTVYRERGRTELNVDRKSIPKTQFIITFMGWGDNNPLVHISLRSWWDVKTLFVGTEKQGVMRQ
jgi:hypothetical protein